MLSSGTSPAEELFVWNCIHVSIGAFIVYEYFLTIAYEVRTTWSRKNTQLAGILLVFNRYAALAFALSEVSLVIPALSVHVFFSQPLAYWLASTTVLICTHSCNVLNALNVVASTILFFLFGAFASLRIFALWRFRAFRWLSLIVFAISLVPVVTNNYALRGFQIIVNPHLELGCSTSFSASSRNMARILSKLSRISVIAVDWLVISLTWAHLWDTWYIKNFKSDLGSVLLRNGSIYFVVLLVLNIAEIVIFQFTEQPYVTDFITAMTSILVSRFIMNLRDIGRRMNAARFSTLSEARVSSYLSDSLGSDLSHGFPGTEDDDDTFPEEEEDSIPFSSASNSLEIGGIVSTVDY